MAPHFSTPFLLLLLLLLRSATTVLSIGVNYGMIADNLPPPDQVVSFIRDKTIIDRVRIFDTNPTVLSAFANTQIALTVTLPNGDIPSVARLPAAKDWVRANISPFYPATKINRILIGNEITASADTNLIGHLVPAMKSIHEALILAGIKNVQVTTPHTLGILAFSEPPSTAQFRHGFDKVVFQPMLDFHRKTKSPFMVNPYPYFSLSESVLNYATFRPNAGIHDPATGITYANMFDAMMDAVYSAMKRMGYADVEIAVAETGWPSMGEPHQPTATLENAVTFNSNLLKHVTSGKGTPLMPGRTFETFIFSLFNENLKPGSLAEKNFGLFRPDFSPVYDMGIMKGQSGGSSPSRPTPSGSSGGSSPSRPTPSGSGRRWCVAKPGTSQQALQSNIDYVCSLGTVDCKPIGAGGPCFEPNSIEAHASYAMNAYYVSTGRHSFNCDFSQTAILTTSNPSHGACQYSS